VFRTQRHMRLNFLVLVLVILGGLALGLKQVEMVVLLFTVTLVLMAEMFNTAVEAIVDLVTQTYHPLAKFAKDIAAGAVLVAVINAFVVGVMLFFAGRHLPAYLSDRTLGADPDWVTIAVAALVLLGVLVTMGKVTGGKGKLWKGGVISAHTALGFFLCVTVLYVSRSIAAAIMAFMLAVLVAQSRVEAKIHTIREVVTGAVLALVLTAAVYWLIAPPHVRHASPAQGKPGPSAHDSRLRTR
jgi:diacylglycerol kinase (ATP)